MTKPLMFLHQSSGHTFVLRWNTESLQQAAAQVESWLLDPQMPFHWDDYKLAMTYVHTVTPLTKHE